ncbi:hypothetical protein [Pseudomonas sp. 2FE]|uniref:hypothetical protein n=1 Tax=Pseudomonas sp. 2FE TaxID=2502190 RepID=UPI0010F68125|nr:hypothetical protein [Pseudomonas sp. 2FE]
MNNLDQTIYQIEQLLSHGGGSSQWFAQAFLSWLSHDTPYLVNLSGIDRLDSANLELFTTMLRIRRDQQLNESERQKLIALADYARQRFGLAAN